VDEAPEATSRILKDGTRATEIIDRLRSLYKQSSPQRELVDINEIVREMLVLLRVEANRYSISTRTELAAAFAASSHIATIVAIRHPLRGDRMKARRALAVRYASALRDKEPCDHETVLRL
jgi:signal transduction histidine kinase